MPHLSPILWLLVVFLFMLVFLSFLSSMWWSQMPSFKLSSKSFSLKNNKWSW